MLVGHSYIFFCEMSPHIFCAFKKLGCLFMTEFFCFCFFVFWYETFGASLVAQRVKRLPTMWETWVRSLGREDPLEKEMATHSSTPAWKTPWMEEPGRLQSMESQRVGHDWATSLSLWDFYQILELWKIIMVALNGIWRIKF